MSKSFARPEQNASNVLHDFKSSALTYKANDIFLKSCSGKPVRNKVEHPPFNCPFAVAMVIVWLVCWSCVIPVVPCIGWPKPYGEKSTVRNLLRRGAPR